MKSPKLGESTSASVENITNLGIWLFVKNKEYFLNYEDYPYFQYQTIKSIQNVRLLHSFHLYWPELDVDLELDNLENPQKYPLKDKVEVIRENSNKTKYQMHGREKDTTSKKLKKKAN